jgi:hypothetical protein
VEARQAVEHWRQKAEAEALARVKAETKLDESERVRLAEINAARAEARAEVASLQAKLDNAEKVRLAQIEAQTTLVAELRAELAELRKPWWRRMMG